MSAVRGNAHRRADLLRLKSVIESVTQVRVAAGHSAWHRQIPHQRASCGMSGAYRVGGERAGVWPEMRTRRAGGGTFRRMYECVRVRKWEAPPPSRPRRMRTLRSLGGHAGCAAHARTGCRCAERCSAACVRVRVRLHALPGDLIPAEVRWQVLSRAVPQLADKGRGRRWRGGVLFRTSTAVITDAIRIHQRRHMRALVVLLTFPPQASASSRTN